MARIIKGDNGVVVLRLDGAYIASGKHLVNAYINDEDEKRWFGNFKFQDSKEAKKTLKEAVKKSDYSDTIFDGQYPKWVEDSYGESLAVQNRIKFYKSLQSKELIDSEEIQDYVYALEIHLKKTKEDGIFLAVARAIATGANESAYNDDLFNDFVEKRTDENPTEETPEIEVAEDDLPF